jgi:hypothetical protein
VSQRLEGGTALLEVLSDDRHRKPPPGRKALRQLLIALPMAIAVLTFGSPRLYYRSGPHLLSRRHHGGSARNATASSQAEAWSMRGAEPPRPATRAAGLHRVAPYGDSSSLVPGEVPMTLTEPTRQSRPRGSAMPSPSCAARRCCTWSTSADWQVVSFLTDDPPGARPGQPVVGRWPGCQLGYLVGNAPVVKSLVSW